MNHHTNIVRIKAVSNALKELNDKVVFVGGATVSLYAERKVAEVRPTDDIDVIIEIINYSDQARLDEQLRKFGFINDTESGIICRYRIEGITVDVMPTQDTALGFTNIWYPAGFKNAVEYKLDDEHSVKILSAPYFLATKFEAFKGRGGNDGRFSHDFEDIVFVLENRKSIWDEIKNADEEVKTYLINEFSELLKTPFVHEWIDGHVERGSPPATYLILEEIEKLVSAQ